MALQLEKRIEAFDMYIQIDTTNSIDKKYHQQQNTSAYEPTKRTSKFIERKMQYSCHVIRGERYELLPLIIQAIVQGKIPVR